MAAPPATHANGVPGHHSVLVSASWSTVVVPGSVPCRKSQVCSTPSGIVGSWR